MIKISKIKLKIILYFMLRKETNLAQTTKLTQWRPQLLFARRPRIPRPNQPQIALPPTAALIQQQAGPAAGSAAGPNPPRPARATPTPPPQQQAGPAMGPNLPRPARACNRGRAVDPLCRLGRLAPVWWTHKRPHQRLQDPLRRWRQIRLCHHMQLPRDLLRRVLLWSSQQFLHEL